MRHTKPSADIEKQGEIFVLLITETDFLKEIHPIIKTSTFDPGSTYATIWRFIDAHFQEHDCAIGERIFIEKYEKEIKPLLGEDEESWIFSVLVKRSNEAKAGKYDKNDLAWYVASAKEFIHDREFKSLSEKRDSAVARGNRDQVAKIEQEISELQTITNTEAEGMLVSMEDMGKEFSIKREWLWREHIPKGLPVMFTAREGEGKTSNLLQICKEILEENEEGCIIWLATEGIVLDTFDKIRLLGLDKSGRFFIPKNRHGDYHFNLMDKNELNAIKIILDKAPATILFVVVDNLSSSVLEISENEDRIKFAIVGLNTIVCEQLKSTLGWIHHCAKQKVSLKDLYAGSTVIMRNVKRGFAIINKEKHTRVIKMIKNNLLGTQCTDLISIENEGIIAISGIEDEDESTREKAESLLINAFKDTNKVRAKDVLGEADRMEISRTILNKLKSKLGIDSQKQGLVWIWVWRLKRK